MYFTKALLVLASLVLMVSACQSTATPTPESSKNTSTPSQSPTITTPDPPQSTVTPTPLATAESEIELSPEELRGVSISLWHVWPGSLGEVFNQLVADFNTSNAYGIEVNPVYQGNYNELYEKVSSAIDSGDPPNIAVGYNYELLSWNHNGKTLVNLNTYVNDPIWGLSDQERDDFYAVFWDQDEIEGVRIGVPAQRFGLLMHYNTTWAEELGFENPPQTTRQFKQQACAAAQKKRTNDDTGDDGTGGWVANTSPSGVLSWMYAFGSEVVNPRGTGYQFDTPQTEAALAFLKDLHDNGCAWEIVEAEFAGEEFASRQALFITTSIADLPEQREAFAESTNTDAWTVLPFPAPTAREPVVDVYGPSFAMFRDTERANLASWEFLKWFLSPQVQAHWVSSGHTFPIRAATMDHLEAFVLEHPQWTQALALLPYAKSEPGLQSWNVVRWAVSDVGTQMFRAYFTSERIPAAAELLNKTASELNERMEP